MSVTMENFMAIKTDDGTSAEVLGKYMYYSLPNLVVKVSRVKDICQQIEFPVEVNDKISITDAYRSATGSIYDRIVETVNDEKKVTRIYCRDNKKTEDTIISRELVEETLDDTTNTYKKLANFVLNKESRIMELSDVDYSSDRDIRGYFRQAEELFELYQDCLGNRSIETLAEKYIARMRAISISARGHHYFVPKAYMHDIQLLEDFMDLVGKENLYTYPDSRRDSKYISMNSMYVADDEKQRGKMAREFYLDMSREIEEYQKRIGKLIQKGNTSQKILDRWELKIQSLEMKKREYESILKKDLSGVDEEFTMLNDLCNQFRMGVKSTQLWDLKAAA